MTNTEVRAPGRVLLCTEAGYLLSARSKTSIAPTNAAPAAPMEGKRAPSSRTIPTSWPPSGEDMGGAIERARRLDQEIQAMNSACPLMRLYVVAANFDAEIARGSSTTTNPPSPPWAAL